MITRYLFQNPRIVWLVVAIILIAGIASLSVMPRLEDPILKQRVGVITVEFHGAGPLEIESSIVVPIEQLLSGFAEIKQVRSNTKANATNLVIELKDRVDDPDSVWSAIKSRLSDETDLPSGCSEPELTVFPLKAFAAILALKPDSRVDSFALRRLARELKKKIQGLDATESVQVFGDAGEEITVRVTPKALAVYGVSIGSIAQQIATSQVVPAGDHEQNGLQLRMSIDESSDIIDRLEDTFIRTPQAAGEPIQLSEVATVRRSVPEPAMTEAIVDGETSIVLGAMVDNQARVDQWARQLDEVVSQFESEFSGCRVESIFSQSDHIRQRMANLFRNLIISTAAVASIVFLLMGWRCMLVVAISLPLSACLVLVGLRWLSIPIHQISITGLVVALGLLIDNSIVVVEEVRSRIFAGRKSLPAIVETIQHLRVPLLGSTLTTILAFLPIATMPGPSGEFVGSLAVSVILAIGASYLLAMTVTPSLVSMLGVNSSRQGLLEYGLRSQEIAELYRKSLRVTFRRPVIGIVIGLALPAIGFYFSPTLTRSFFPASDRAQIQVEIDLTQADSLNSVRESVERVTEILSKDARIKHQYWFLGHSAPTFYYNVVPRRRNSPNYAQAIVEVDKDSNLEILVNALQKKVDTQALNARVLVRQLEQGPPFDAPVEVRVFGDNLAQLKEAGVKVRRMLTELPEVTHTRSDLGNGVPQLALGLDSRRIRESGLTPNEVSRFLYTGIEGAKAGDFFDHGDQIPVHVRVDYEERSTVETLPALKIPLPRNPMGSQSSNAPAQPQGQPGMEEFDTLLGSLGDFQLKSNVGAIIRINGQRVNEVKAYLRAGALPSMVSESVRQMIGQTDLPAQFRIEYGGESEKRSQAITTLIANAAVLFSLMMLTLVVSLGSFRSALIIASVGGLVMGLSPLALSWFGFPFGFMAIVGTMGLIGVAINDSIVVLAAIRANESVSSTSDQAASDMVTANEPQPLEDVIVGCTRHILTTTFTTMIGFLPLVVDGGRFWPPLAIVVAAGVFGATLLALYFVPSAHLLICGRGRARNITTEFTKN